MEGFENQGEKIPTKEDILNIIQEHFEGLEYEVSRELSDDGGVYLLEIITKVDSDGYTREYTYSRKSLKTGEELEPKVYVAYMEDDIPVGGEEINI